MLLYIGTEKDAPGINATGWYYGNFTQLKYQAIAALFIIVLNAVATFVILKIIGIFVPLRMDRDSRLHEQHSRSGPDYIDGRRAHLTRGPGGLDEASTARASRRALS
jgi:hypothetical protein